MKFSFGSGQNVGQILIHPPMKNASYVPAYFGISLQLRAHTLSDNLSLAGILKFFWGYNSWEQNHTSAIFSPTSSNNPSHGDEAV